MKARSRTYPDSFSIQEWIASHRSRPCFGVWSSSLTLCLFHLLAANPALGATFVVTNTNAEGAGSFHDAINQANTQSGTDVITFAIPGAPPFVIELFGDSPGNFLFVRDTVTIDGRSQPGGEFEPVISLINPIFILTTDRCQIFNLVFPNRLVVSTGNHNLIEGCWFSADPTGMNATQAPSGAIANGNDNHFRACLFSGSRGHGLCIDGSRNRVTNSLFGLDKTGGNIIRGLSGSGNLGSGIVIFGDDNIVGGDTQGEGNVFAGNRFGIDAKKGKGNKIMGNLIGLDKSGLRGLGNRIAGVKVDRSVAPTIIGGPGERAGNVIAANRRAGILLKGTVNTIQILNNIIGPDINRNRIGGARQENGILVSDRSEGIQIGDGDPDHGNTIAYNWGPGINVVGDGTVNNSIMGNSIFDNDGLGIDLGGDGVTNNDILDMDVGPNQRQNFPKLESVEPSGPLAARVRGVLNSRPSFLKYRIEFFANPVDDPTGHGEGHTFIGSATVTTDIDGNAEFDVTLNVEVGRFDCISMTATELQFDRTLQTSEFSPCVRIRQPQDTDRDGTPDSIDNAPLTFNEGQEDTDNDGIGDVDDADQGGAAGVDGVKIPVTNTNPDGPGSLPNAIDQANSTPEKDRIGFNIPGEGPHRISPTQPIGILQPLEILGNTQPGYFGEPVIEVDGSLLQAGSGLAILSGDSTLYGLAINNFPGHGVNLQDAGGNLLSHLHVGVDPAGEVAKPNDFHGVSILNSSDNEIRESLISGNGANPELGQGVGVFITEPASINNRVVQNRIGVNRLGDQSIPNLLDGVLVQNAPGTVISENQISGNGRANVAAFGESASGTRVMHNKIGADGAGVGRPGLGSAGDGILVSNAPNTQIGGEEPDEGNVIVGSGINGVFVSGPAAGITIQNNNIGMNLGGTSATGNEAGGVFVQNADGIQILVNTIVSSLLKGVVLDAVSNAILRANHIGASPLDPDDETMGQELGVLLENGSANNQIGGPNPTDGNVIGNNQLDGVSITAGAGQGNSILSNLIFNNGGLGINHGTNGGPQPAPVLTEVREGSIVVTGTVTGDPNTAHTVQAFANLTPDPTDAGEGEFLLGSVEVMTDGSGMNPFELIYDLDLHESFEDEVDSASDFTVHISTTSTNLSTENTSEFSANVSFFVRGVTEEVDGLILYDVFPDLPDGAINSGDLLEWLRRLAESIGASDTLFDFARFWQAEGN